MAVTEAASVCERCLSRLYGSLPRCAVAVIAGVSGRAGTTPGLGADLPSAGRETGVLLSDGAVQWQHGGGVPGEGENTPGAGSTFGAAGDSGLL